MGDNMKKKINMSLIITIIIGSLLVTLICFKYTLNNIKEVIPGVKINENKILGTKKTVNAEYFSYYSLEDKEYLQVEVGNEYKEEDGTIVYNPISFKIDCEKFNIPGYLSDYNSDIYFVVTYIEQEEMTSYDSKYIKSVKVMDVSTDKEIKDFSRKNLDEKYHSLETAPVVEKSWVTEIKLSELKEGTIYKYHTTSEVNTSPIIINDTGKNVEISTKHSNSNFYDTEFMFAIILDSDYSLNTTYEKYKPGDSYSIMFKYVSSKKILSKISDSDVILLSEYSEKNEIDPSFEDYIYNDTDKIVKIRVQDELNEVKYDEVFTINPKEIVEFDWKVDSLTIE